MGIQKFDAIATKFLQLLPMSSPPTFGLYATSDGGVGIAVGGIRVAKFGGTNGTQGAVPSLLTADGAISPSTSARYVITKAGVLAATLAAPSADGIEINILSDTANAHTLTATGLLQTGTASVNLATFAAQKGAGLTLRSYNSKWNVISSVGITFS